MGLFGRTLDKTLKTQSSWWEARGISPQAIAEMTTEHWGWTALALIAAIASIWGLVRTFGG